MLGPRRNGQKNYNKTNVSAVLIRLTMLQKHTENFDVNLVRIRIAQKLMTVKKVICRIEKSYLVERGDGKNAADGRKCAGGSVRTRSITGTSGSP